MVSMNPSITVIGRIPAGGGTVLGMTATDLVRTLHEELHAGSAAARIARVVAEHPPHLPPGGLTGSTDRVAGHLLHAEAGLSLIALVWLPGRVTRIHDHLCWCVVHVLQGTVRETRYREQGDRLTTTTALHRGVGSTSLLLPPDDIHRIANDATDTAITLHVYGMDLRTGGSTRRRYDDIRSVA